jgi:hypothetical protein
VLGKELDGGKVIYRSVGKTSEVSLHLSRNRAYWKGAEFVPRRLRDVYERGPEVLEEHAAVVEPAYTRRLYRAPDNATMLRFAARQALRITKKAARIATYRQVWFVALRRLDENGDLLERRQARGFEHLEPPAGRFFADSFLLRRNGASHLFFEDFDFTAGRAGVSHVELHDTGAHGAVEPVLAEPHHLSYPFVFEHDGEAFMIPESRQARRIDVYRATDFPRGWALETTLLRDIEAVDATLFEHEGDFYLFTNVATPGASSSEELHLFVSKSPFGPFREHPTSPVVSDVSCSRPAGRIQRRGTELLRPAQDCSHGYGHSIRFQRILALSRTHYAEEHLFRIGPEWTADNLGSHCYDNDGTWEVIDGHRYHRRF